MELLTGVPAGTVDEEGTVNGLVNRRLRALATGLKAFAASSDTGGINEQLLHNHNRVIGTAERLI